MAASQQSTAETSSLVDEWLTVDSRGHQRACRLNDVLFVSDNFSEAFDFMQKAVNTIQQTTKSWSVKTGESGSTRHVVLRCAISKYSTRVRRGEDGKFVRRTNGGGGQGKPRKYTGSRRHFDCHAHIELAIVDHDKAEAAKGKKTILVVPKMRGKVHKGRRRARGTMHHTDAERRFRLPEHSLQEKDEEQ